MTLGKLSLLQLLSQFLAHSRHHPLFWGRRAALLRWKFWCEGMQELSWQACQALYFG